MDQDITIKIEGLKLVSKAGLPTPLEKGDLIESVYFLADEDNLTFRLGTYNFKEKYFRSDNGYGGEIWQPEQVIAWNYWICDTGDGETEDGVRVSIL